MAIVVRLSLLPLGKSCYAETVPERREIGAVRYTVNHGITGSQLALPYHNRSDAGNRAAKLSETVKYTIEVRVEDGPAIAYAHRGTIHAGDHVAPATPPVAAMAERFRAGMVGSKKRVDQLQTGRRKR